MFCYKLCLMSVYKYFILIRFIQTIWHVSIIYLYNFYVNALKTYNINFDIKIGEIKHWLHLWLVLMWVHTSTRIFMESFDPYFEDKHQTTIISQLTKLLWFWNWFD